MWLAKFADEENSYIAVGQQKNAMRVFEAWGNNTGGISLAPRRMTFPGCLRFLDAEVTYLENVKQSVIEKEYGKLPQLPQSVIEDDVHGTIPELPPSMIEKDPRRKFLGASEEEDAV